MNSLSLVFSNWKWKFKSSMHITANLFAAKFYQNEDRKYTNWKKSVIPVFIEIVFYKLSFYRSCKGLHLLCTFKHLLYFLYVDVVEQAVFLRPESLESISHFLFLSFDDWFRQPAITCCFTVIEKLTNDYIFSIFLCNGLWVLRKIVCHAN